jgi:thiol-disulfide isomerase/thioredoxin
MKTIFTLTLALFTLGVLAQNKKTAFCDSIGQVNSRDAHWALVISGKFKSVYNESENKKKLVRMPAEEFATELHNTETRITKSNKTGTELPDFDETDIHGNQFTRNGLKGKITVINIWFIGCPPCEMERPALNELTKFYQERKDIIFLSFAAKNTREQVVKYMENNAILYNAFPMDKEFIKKFEIHEYPVNIVVDRNGKCLYYSSGTGVGITTILKQQIDKALKE